MRVNRLSNTASAKPFVAKASSEYVDTRLKPLDVTIVGAPTRTQFRTIHGVTTTIDTTPKRAAARQPARHTSHAAATTTRPGDMGPEHRREHDDRRTERDIEELADTHVGARDPIEGAEQGWVQRRAERRRVQIREREPRRDAVSVRKGGGDQ